MCPDYDDWVIPPTSEQPPVSPHVNQFLADYLHVRKTMLANDTPVTLEYADLALSIVNDSYNHERGSKHKRLLTPSEMQGLIDEIGGMPCDHS